MGTLSSKNNSLNSFFDDHYREYASVHKKSFYHDEVTFNRHLRHGLGEIPMCIITVKEIEKWILNQKKEGYKNTTINKHIVLLKRLFNLAERWDFQGVKTGNINRVRKLFEGEPTQHFLSQDDLSIILKECDYSDNLFLGKIVRFLILTGCRKGEALQARWNQIDLKFGIWTVPMTKNGRPRRIFISSTCRDFLQKLVEFRQNLNLSSTNDDPLFTNLNSGRPYKCIQTAWMYAKKNCGKEHVRIHDLRHTFASILINNGATIYEVQRLLGHSSVNVTQRYAHLLPNKLCETADLISRITL